MNPKEPFKALIAVGIAFIWEVIHNDKGNYGVIAVARAALSTILSKQGNVTFKKDSNVDRMLRGRFKLRPPLLKQIVTYDPNIVLKYMDSLPTNKNLSLELLTKSYVPCYVFLVVNEANWLENLKLINQYCHIGHTLFIPILIQKQ